MASSPHSFLLQLVRYVSSLPTNLMRIRPLAAPKPKPPGPPAEGPGGHGGIIHVHAASPVPRELMRAAAPPRQGASWKTHPPKGPKEPAEGKGGSGGIIHAASS